MREKNFNNERPERGLCAAASIVEETAAEPVDQPVEESPKKESKVGVVSNCVKLNLRRSPLKDSDGKNIIAELPIGTAVVIDDEKSTDEFYKVITEDGTEGYCMKEFFRLTW